MKSIRASKDLYMVGASNILKEMSWAMAKNLPSGENCASLTLDLKLKWLIIV